METMREKTALSTKKRMLVLFRVEKLKHKKCVCKTKPNERGKLKIRFDLLRGTVEFANFHRFNLKDIRVETVTRRIMNTNNKEADEEKGRLKE